MQLPKGRPDRFTGWPDEYEVIHPDTQEIIQIADSVDAIDAKKAAVGFDPNREAEPTLDTDGYAIIAYHEPAEPGQEPCATCAFFANGDHCDMFNLPTASTDTCAYWSKTR